MNVVFLLEAGIPSYRNFLFNFLYENPSINQLLIIHTGRIYDSKEGDYLDKRVKFIGSNKLGFHLGIWKYLWNADVVVSSYNLRIITCWIPSFIFRNKWIFWGKGLGENDNFLINFIRSITARNCRYILVYNEVKKKQLVSKMNVLEEKIIAYQNTIKISHPIDFSKEKKSYFLYFGRIQKRKGLLELLANYKLYIEEFQSSKSKLRFVGDGDFKKELIEYVKENKLDEYVEFFPGAYTENEIKEHFKYAKVYVSPYNVGLAVINSFAYGVGVLTCSFPQVGPEFYYLNNLNSIIVEEINYFKDIFLKLDNENVFDGEKLFEFYLNNLSYKIMERNFLDTIIKVGNE